MAPIIVSKDLALEIIENKFPFESQDPDSILTEEELEEIKESIESGFLNSKDIDWEHLEDLQL